MRKFVIAIVLLICTAGGLSSCNQATGTAQVTCEEIAQAYSEAGYVVFHSDYEDLGFCMVSAKPNEESEYAIYFHIYNTIEEAQAMQEQEEYNLVIWLFASLLGESSWLESKSYNNVQYSYFDSDMVKPFDDLLSAKGE